MWHETKLCKVDTEVVSRGNVSIDKNLLYKELEEQSECDKAIEEVDRRPRDDGECEKQESYWQDIVQKEATEALSGEGVVETRDCRVRTANKKGKHRPSIDRLLKPLITLCYSRTHSRNSSRS